MNLLFCIDTDFIDLLINCLHSILEHNACKQYDVYILHSDLTPEKQGRIERCFKSNVYFHFIEVDDRLFAGFPKNERYPLQIYYRLIAPLLLPKEVERILYLDADTININSLRELYTSDFEAYGYIACTHTRKFLTRLNLKRLRISKDVPYANTGMLLMNVPLLKERISLKEIKQFVIENKNRLFLYDQDILCALYGDLIKLSDTMRYNLSDRILHFYNADFFHPKCTLEWIKKNTVIIHYCGKNKPWKKHYIGILDQFYHSMRKEEVYG